MRNIRNFGSFITGRPNCELFWADSLVTRFRTGRRSQRLPVGRAPAAPGRRNDSRGTRSSTSRKHGARMKDAERECLPDPPLSCFAYIRTADPTRSARSLAGWAICRRSAAARIHRGSAMQVRTTRATCVFPHRPTDRAYHPRRLVCNGAAAKYIFLLSPYRVRALAIECTLGAATCYASPTRVIGRISLRKHRELTSKLAVASELVLRRSVCSPHFESLSARVVDRFSWNFVPSESDLRSNKIESCLGTSSLLRVFLFVHSLRREYIKNIAKVRLA